MESTVEKKCPICKSMHTDDTKCCESCKARAKVRYDSKKEEILQQQKEDRIKNPGKYKQKSSKYREKNRDIINEKQNKRYAEDPKPQQEANKARRNTRDGMLKSIYKGAKDRDLSITMTDEEIMNMTDLPCVYCGKESEDRVCRNGIDRVDSSLGYDINNCVPCCGDCNLSKGQLDPLTFIERNKQISQYHGGLGEITHNWSKVSKEWYGRYKNRMIGKGKTFDLTKEEFESIRASDCVYCGRSSNFDHSNGIDCVDPKEGYILSNCVSACKDCNFMKKMQSQDNFIMRSKKIALCIFIFPDVTRVLTTFVKKIRLIIS